MKIIHIVINGLVDRDLDDEIKLAPRQAFKIVYETFPLPTPEQAREFMAHLIATYPTPEPAPPGKFRCAECDGLFNKGRSDEDAAAELCTPFPGATTDDCALICDDCFKALGLSEDETAPGWGEP